MNEQLVYPNPKPDQGRYNSILEEGFKRYPERYENYLKYKNAKRETIVNYQPIKLDVENVSRCNLRCDMCQMTGFKDFKRAEDMSFENFKNIVDELYGLIEIKIQGIGEPFIGKDFIQMVEYASSRSIWTRTSTNATILHQNENYKRIIDAGIGELQISVDGTTKQTYEKIRRNARFEKMVDNCSIINEYCDSEGLLRTRMWVLLQKDNFHELYHFPSFGKELGFKRVAIIMDVNGWGDQTWTDKNNPKKVSGMVTQSDIDFMLEEAKGYNIDLGFWDINSKYNSENPCLWPFERAFISSDMKVVPCCMIANPETYSLGDLVTFEKIWNDDSYRQFRESHLNGNVPEVCKFCYQ